MLPQAFAALICCRTKPAWLRPVVAATTAPVRSLTPRWLLGTTAFATSTSRPVTPSFRSHALETRHCLAGGTRVLAAPKDLARKSSSAEALSHRRMILSFRGQVLLTLSDLGALAVGLGRCGHLRCCRSGSRRGASGLGGVLVVLVMLRRRSRWRWSGSNCSRRCRRRGGHRRLSPSGTSRQSQQGRDQGVLQCVHSVSSKGCDKVARVVRLLTCRVVRLALSQRRLDAQG